MVVQVPGPPWASQTESQSIQLSKQEPSSLLNERADDTRVPSSDNQSLVYQSSINMVIKQEKSDHYVHEAKADVKDSFVFAVPAKKAPSSQNRTTPLVEWKNTLNMRPVMLGNLAARREQFDASLGRIGTSHGTSSRTRSTTRPGVGAAKSLDLLRINLQPAINKDIQQVLNKYLERFFQPAMENIRSNLGSESVVDDHVRAVCQRVLEEAKEMYLTSFQSESKSKSERIREGHKWHQPEYSAVHHASHPATKPHLKVQLANKSYQQIQLKPHLQAELKAQVHNFPNLRSACGGVVQQSSNTHYKWQAQTMGTPSTPNHNQNLITRKRKEIENDLESIHRKRSRPCELPSGQPVAAVSRMFQVTPINYQGPKWDPARITKDTLFVMGARANKVLGFGQTRGRLYLKHNDLFKYCGDQEDREWLVQHNFMAPSSGKAYLMVVQDIHELALSDEYKNNPNVMLQELKGFRAPEFMLNKIRSYLTSLRTEPLADLSELLDMQLLPEFCDKEGKLSFDTGPSSSSLLDSGVPPMDESLMELALEYGVTLMSESHNQLDVPNQLSSSSTVLATLPPSLEALTQGVNSSRSASSCSSLSPSVSPSPPCLPHSPVDSPHATTTSPVCTSTCSPKSMVTASASTPCAIVSPLEPSSTSNSVDVTKSDSNSLTCSSLSSADSNSETKPLLKTETNQSILDSQNLGLSLELPISATLEELELLIKTESCLSGNSGNDNSLNSNDRSPSGNTILASLDPQTDVFDEIMRADGVTDGDKNSLSSSVGSQTTPDLNLDAGLDASLDANLDLNLDVNLDVNLDTMTEATALEIAYLGLMLDSDASNSELHVQSQSNENYSQISIPLEGNENALAMSHATLSALLSGNTLEGLEIPDALL